MARTLQIGRPRILKEIFRFINNDSTYFSTCYKPAYLFSAKYSSTSYAKTELKYKSLTSLKRLQMAILREATVHYLDKIGFALSLMCVVGDSKEMHQRMTRKSSEMKK